MIIDLQKYQQALRDARQEVRNLTVMAMAPDLLPNDLELVRNLKHLAWLRAGEAMPDARAREIGK